MEMPETITSLSSVEQQDPFGELVTALVSPLEDIQDEIEPDFSPDESWEGWREEFFTNRRKPVSERDLNSLDYHKRVFGETEGYKGSLTKEVSEKSLEILQKVRELAPEDCLVNKSFVQMIQGDVLFALKEDFPNRREKIGKMSLRPNTELEFPRVNVETFKVSDIERDLVFQNSSPEDWQEDFSRTAPDYIKNHSFLLAQFYYQKNGKEKSFSVFYPERMFKSEKTCRKEIQRMFEAHQKASSSLQASGERTKAVILPSNILTRDFAHGDFVFVQQKPFLKDNIETVHHELTHALLVEKYGRNRFKYISEGAAVWEQVRQTLDYKGHIQERFGKQGYRKFVTGPLKEFRNNLPIEDFPLGSKAFVHYSEKFWDTKYTASVRDTEQYAFGFLFTQAYTTLYRPEKFQKLYELTSEKTRNLYHPQSGKCLIENGNVEVPDEELIEGAIIAAGGDPLALKKRMRAILFEA